MTLSLPDWLREAAGPNALSRPAWLLLGLPSLMWSVTYLVGQEGHPFLTSVLWGGLAWLALGLVWLVARYTWMSGGTPTYRALMLTPTYVLAAIARSAVMDVAAVDPVRISVFTIVTMTGFSIAASATVGTFRELVMTNGHLVAIRDALVQADSRARTESLALRSSARQVIVAAVEAALREGGSLREVSDEVVRPLSHDLARAEGDTTAIASATPRRDLRSLADAVAQAGPIRPVVTATLVAAMTLSISYLLYGFPKVFPATGLWWLVLFALLQGLRLLPWRRLSGAVVALLLPVALFGVGFLGIAVVRVIGRQDATYSGGSYFAAILLVLVGGLVAVVRGMTFQQRDLEEQLIEDSSRLATSTSVTQAQIRRERRYLSQVLHGVVQPRLVARAIRARIDSESVGIDDVVGEISRLLGDDAESHASQDVVRSIRDLADVWEGTAQITTRVDPDLDGRLGHVPAIARAVQDVAAEAINNAILRAGASWVDVTVAYDGSAVTIEVVNPAPPAGTSIRADGLGSQLFDEVTDTWAREPRDGKVYFTAVLRVPNRASTGIALPESQDPLQTQ